MMALIIATLHTLNIYFPIDLEPSLDLVILALTYLGIL